MRIYRTAVWRSLPIDMAEFASYYENTWIGTSISNPNFAPQMWNQHEATQMMIQRSSNIPEGWHHGFHSMLSCSKPTIWKSLDCLKAEQALTDVKKTKRDGRELPEPRAPKWIRYDQQLQRIVSTSNEKPVQLRSYWKCYVQRLASN